MRRNKRIKVKEKTTHQLGRPRQQQASVRVADKVQKEERAGPKKNRTYCPQKIGAISVIGPGGLFVSNNTVESGELGVSDSWRPSRVAPVRGAAGSRWEADTTSQTEGRSRVSLRTSRGVVWSSPNWRMRPIAVRQMGERGGRGGDNWPRTSKPVSLTAFCETGRAWSQGLQRVGGGLVCCVLVAGRRTARDDDDGTGGCYS